MENPTINSFNKEYEIVLLGSPGEAEQALKRAGVNYFYINLSMPLAVPPSHHCLHPTT